MSTLDDIAADLAPLAGLFRDAGYSLYLVGGIVRDSLLGIVPPVDDPRAGDIDLTTDARPDAILNIVRPLASALWTQGERFGTIGATVDGRPLEITTYRAESYDELSRKPVVTFGDDLETDLSRRDFTINAIAVDALTGRLVDPYGGATDLDHQRLRTPRNPRVSFGDDPLRMLRAARFIPRFDLTADPDLVAAAAELVDRLSIVSVERIHDEFERLLGVDEPATGLAFAIETGLLARVLGVDADDAQLREAARQAATGQGLLERRSRLLAGLGRASAADMLSRLRYSVVDRQATLAQLDLAAMFATEPVAAPTMRRAADATRLVDANERSAALESALGLLEAGGQAGDRPSAFRDLLADCVAADDLGPFTGPLDGRDLMARFALSPGPLVGRATAFQRQLRYERGSLSADDAAIAIGAWLETQSAS